MMDIPVDVMEALDYEVARAGLEYVDNYRAYRYKDSFGYDEFIASRKRGCCGFFETTIVDENHDTWMVGCNYGH